MKIGHGEYSGSYVPIISISVEGLFMLTVGRATSVVAVFVGMLVCGCAFTAEKVTVNHQLSSAIQPVVPDEKISLTVGQIEDKRAVDDPNTIMHKMNLNGNVTSGTYQAEKPLSDIVRDALAQAFPQAQASSDNRSYRLYGKLLDFTYESVMGLVTSKVNSKISVQLYLEDASTGKVVWSEAFIGRGQVKEYHGAHDAIAKMVAFAVDDFVSQVVASKALLDYLQAAPSVASP